jgi:hypothetical protein
VVKILKLIKWRVIPTVVNLGNTIVIGAERYCTIKISLSTKISVSKGSINVNGACNLSKKWIFNLICALK